MKRLIAAGGIVLFMLPLMPERASAQSEILVQQGIRACAANPAACALVVAAGGVLYWQYRSSTGPILVPIPRHLRRTALSESPRRDGHLRQAEPLPRQRRTLQRVPGESHINPGDRLNPEDYNIPGSMEVHAAVSRDDCRKMEATFKRQGRRVKLVQARRVRNAARDGGVFEYLCIFEGEGSTDDWYDDQGYRRQRRN